MLQQGCSRTIIESFTLAEALTIDFKRKAPLNVWNIWSVFFNRLFVDFTKNSFIEKTERKWEVFNRDMKFEGPLFLITFALQELKACTYSTHITCDVACHSNFCEENRYSKFLIYIFSKRKVMAREFSCIKERNEILKSSDLCPLSVQCHPFIGHLKFLQRDGWPKLQICPNFRLVLIIKHRIKCSLNI